MGQLCNVICLLASSTSAMCCPCFNQAACWAKVVVIIGFVFAPIMTIVMLPLAPGIREGNIFTELCLGGTYCFHDTRFDEDSLELFIGAEMYANMNDNTVKEYGPVEMEYFGVSVARYDETLLLSSEAKKRHAAARKIARGNKHITPRTVDVGNAEHLAHAADVSRTLLPSLPKLNRKQFAAMAKNLKGLTKKPAAAASRAPESKTHLLEGKDESEPWRDICPVSDFNLPPQFTGKEGGFIISRGGINENTYQYESENPRTDSVDLSSSFEKVSARPAPLSGITSMVVLGHLYLCVFAVSYQDTYGNSTESAVPECDDGRCTLGFRLGSNGPTEGDSSLNVDGGFPANFGWDFTASNVQVIAQGDNPSASNYLESKGFRNNYELYPNDIGGFVGLSFIFWAIPIALSIAMCCCPAKFAQDPAAAAAGGGV